MNALASMVLPVALTPEAMEALRTASRLTPADIELIACAVVEKLRTAPMGWAVKEFAAHIGRSPSYVHAEIRAGRLRAMKAGGHGDRRITPQCAMEWMTRDAGSTGAEV